MCLLSHALGCLCWQIKQARPLTHDLTNGIVKSLGYAITRVVISDLVSNTYYARVFMARTNAQGKPEGTEVDVDARPSDAINLAMRSQVSRSAVLCKFGSLLSFSCLAICCSTGKWGKCTKHL